MLDKKEKAILMCLIDNSKGKETFILSAEEIMECISKKNVVSLANLSVIMLSLSKDGYFDYVPSESKKGQTYCVNLKKKALTFKRDLQKQKKGLALLFARTAVLALVSFIVGAILKAIF